MSTEKPWRLRESTTYGSGEALTRRETSRDTSEPSGIPAPTTVGWPSDLNNGSLSVAVGL